jgi:hypothetical protein
MVRTGSITWGLFCASVTAICSPSQFGLGYRFEPPALPTLEHIAIIEFVALVEQNVIFLAFEASPIGAPKKERHKLVQISSFHGSNPSSQYLHV